MKGWVKLKGVLLTAVLSLLLFIPLFQIIPSSALGQDKPYELRKPAVAGTFYPSDRAVLEGALDGYLKVWTSKAKRLSPHIVAILAPHAGYAYSGKVAAAAYHQIQGKDYRTVVVLGSSHYVPFKGISIYPSGYWETPLGKVPVDAEAAALLLKECKSLQVYYPPFEKEHSLEVQIPFLQKTLRTFKIVPLITGTLAPDEFRALTDALSKLLEKNPLNTLIVVSTDLSHFHDYDTARKLDKVALEDIQGLNTQKLVADLNKGNCEMCGAPGVVILTMLAGRLDARPTLLDYANSGDVTSDRRRVVGYASMAFSLSEEERLTQTEQKKLLAIARQTLEGYISKGIVPEFDVKEKRLIEKKGAFVTLTKGGNLRGCIGYILPVQPLHRAVKEMAINASTRDPRFPAVAKAELKEIHIEISVLGPLKPIAKVDEIEVGKHGLVISRGGQSGLLLPQVAVDHNWNRDEFLRQSCIKAGLPPAAWKEKGTVIQTFTAQVFSE
jgi:AmmeMemoRadiSam system protein B/AmmeMemoRadiSam system protein A